MHLKILSVKCRPSCSGRDELTHWFPSSSHLPEWVGHALIVQNPLLVKQLTLVAVFKVVLNSELEVQRQFAELHVFIHLGQLETVRHFSQEIQRAHRRSMTPMNPKMHIWCKKFPKGFILKMTGLSKVTGHRRQITPYISICRRLLIADLGPTVKKHWAMYPATFHPAPSSWSKLWQLWDENKQPCLYFKFSAGVSSSSPFPHTSSLSSSVTSQRRRCVLWRWRRRSPRASYWGWWARSRWYSEASRGRTQCWPCGTWRGTQSGCNGQILLCRSGK